MKITMHSRVIEICKLTIHRTELTAQIAEQFIRLYLNFTERHTLKIMDQTHKMPSRNRNDLFTRSRRHQTLAKRDSLRQVSQYRVLRFEKCGRLERVRDFQHKLFTRAIR